MPAPAAPPVGMLPAAPPAPAPGSTVDGSAPLQAKSGMDDNAKPRTRGWMNIGVDLSLGEIFLAVKARRPPPRPTGGSAGTVATGAIDPLTDLADVCDGEDLWFQVMETKDRSRAERVVAFATAKLPLARMASGPAMQMGQGPVWAEYRHLDWVLQGLEEFPHLGWGLIRTGFHSPVIRNRNMALKAFKNWSRAEWPSDALSVIKRALKKEPDPDVRARLSEFMAGA